MDAATVHDLALALNSGHRTILWAVGTLQIAVLLELGFLLYFIIDVFRYVKRAANDLTAIRGTQESIRLTTQEIQEAQKVFQARPAPPPES